MNNLAMRASADALYKAMNRTKKSLYGRGNTIDKHANFEYLATIVIQSYERAK